MNFNRQLKLRVSKVTIITLAYLMISWYMMLFAQAAMASVGDLSENIRINFFSATLSGLIAGILGGSVLVLINDKIFRRKSYGFALLITAGFYVLVFFFISIVVPASTILIKTHGTASFSDIVYGTQESILSIWTIIYFVQWGVITLLTLFFLQISDKFGPGILSKFLVGKYHQPKEEIRIFMFLDMKSSTTIAEKIGHEKYFNLLNDAFNDITNNVISCGGEIYQYVGDEIVITWKLKEGISNANCLKCFQNIQKRLRARAPWYKDNYGIAPEFKAGLHNGPVTVGEIGSVKRDIVYSGDVLNTTSRIQEQCNRYHVSCLVSNQTLDLLKGQNSFETAYLGDIQLRGKHELINLNTIVDLK